VKTLLDVNQTSINVQDDVVVICIKTFIAAGWRSNELKSKNKKINAQFNA